MRDNKVFGECLNELLKLYKLKSSTLARGINVDSSLIYKWLRNERVPSYSSPHVELIANFLGKSINNSFQRKNIVEALENWGYQVEGPDNGSITEAIRSYLLESQGYTIEVYMNSKDKNGEKSSKKNNNKGEYLSKKADLFNNGQSGKEKSDKPFEDSRQSKQMAEYDKPVNTKDLFYGRDNIKIVKGHKEVLYCALNLLKIASKNPCINDDAILITLNSDMALLTNYKEFNNQWKHTLYNALKNGWKVISVVRLNNNVKRTIKIVEDIQFVLAAGRYYVYYYKRKARISTGNELVIVPQAGALCCLSSHLYNQVDSAFLFKSKSSMEILKGHYLQSISSTKPLLQSYPTKNTLEFKKMLNEVEERLGNKYICKGYPGTITIPAGLYEKYLKAGGKSSKETLKYISLHRRRLEVFKSQIKYYSIKDIWTKESLERLVNEKKPPIEQHYILGNKSFENEDIIAYLLNIVRMLEKYNNYEIAVVSEKDFKSITKMRYMIKDGCSIIIEASSYKNNETSNNYNSSSEINFSISEKNVVHAFQEYFMTTWNNIPEAGKDKGRVIKWLDTLIDGISRGEH